MPLGETISSDLLDVLKSVDLQISNPGSFCSASTENAATLSELMRSLFKTSADSSTITFGPFQELLVDGFDGETIWEELQTRNRPLTRFVKKKIVAISKNISISKKSKAKAMTAATRELDELAMEKDEIVTDDEEDLDSDDANEEDNEELGNREDEEDESVFDRDEDTEDVGSDIDLNMDGDDVEDEEEYEGGGDASYDNIDDMQAWLDKQEDLEERHQKKLARLEKLAAQKGAVEEGPDSDDEEDDMLFVEREMYDDHESEEDDDEDNSSGRDKKKKKKASKNMKGSEIKYEDFFRGDISKTKSESSSTSESAKSSSGKKAKSIIKNDIEEEYGDDDDDDDVEGEENEGDEDDSDGDGDFDENGGDDYDFGDDEEDVEESKSSKVIARTRALTTHEKRELKMAAQIKEIEGENIFS